jgi:HSP20 family protein
MHDDQNELLRFTRRLHLRQHETVQPLRWRPAADVYRHCRGWLIKLELAGVSTDQVKVLTSGRYLCIRGRRRDLALQQGYSFYTMEIVYSEFERTFELPVDLAHAAIEVRCRDGMLMVSITTEPDRP